MMTAEQSPPRFLEGLRLVLSRVNGARRRWFLGFLAVLSAAFLPALLDLVRLAVHTELYSHLFLIPVISLYLVSLKARELPARLTTDWLPALLAGAGGLLVLGLYAWLTSRGWEPERVDMLARSMAAYLAFATAGAFLFLGTGVLRVIAFPWAFLIFLIPFPKAVEDGLEFFFQHTSAEAANLLFAATGLPVLRDGLMFRIPGITIVVAQECSGIRSSLVLFLTSLVAGQMFLSSPWRRAILSLAVIPLGIVRNGFRILTISWLCAEKGPEMIDSPIHRQGGPLFFALSLVPFFACLLILKKLDQTRQR
jgi:exosortase C (VPDSG-CTERM-specific)